MQQRAHCRIGGTPKLRFLGLSAIQGRARRGVSGGVPPGHNGLAGLLCARTRHLDARAAQSAAFVLAQKTYLSISVMPREEHGSKINIAP